MIIFIDFRAGDLVEYKEKVYKFAYKTKLPGRGIIRDKDDETYGSDKLVKMSELKLIPK